MGLMSICLLVCDVTASAQDKFLGRTASEWNQELSSSNSQTRIHAAWAIAQFAGQTASVDHLPALIHLSKDGDPTIRYWGATGLGLYGKAMKDNSNKIAPVIDALQPLLNDASAAPRLAAAGSIASVGKPDLALPVLVAAMDDPQESVRIQAVSALEKMGPAARPALPTLQIAASDSSEYVKRISERSLASLGVAAEGGPTKARGKKAKAKAKTS
jgi:HEAT repeat protein